MKRLILGLVLAALAAAQDGLVVNPTPGPPNYPYQIVYVYTGTNLTYACFAPAMVTTGNRALRTASISAASNASAVSFTSTAHGFDANSRPSVTISGGTGNWTAIIGTFVATITGANTFTIPVDSTTFGALTGTITFTTTAPRVNQPDWAVERYFYDGSNNLILIVWLDGSSGLHVKCADGASTTNNIQ